MSADLVVAIQSWHEIKRDFGANWLIYLSMPLVAAFVGRSTKIVALEMLSPILIVAAVGLFPAGRRARYLALAAVDFLA